MLSSRSLFGDYRVMKTARVGQKEANPPALILFWLFFSAQFSVLEATL